MALKSMTGFARADGHLEGIRWHWEVRTVNGRGLDIRMRLPPGYEKVERPAREACTKRLIRGNCMMSLSIKRDAGDVEVRLNETALRQVIEAIGSVKNLANTGSQVIGPPSIDGILGLKGVLEYTEAEESNEVSASRIDAIIKDLTTALDDIVQARTTEGERLQTAISEQINQIENYIAAAEALPHRQPENIQERLKVQIERLLNTGAELDEQRLHQEAVLLAAKADIEEELERLKSHVAAGRELLAGEGAAGRRLDFLTQEFNRETNTICSKSNDTELTRIGLGLKAVIDQMREQVQNIE